MHLTREELRYISMFSSTLERELIHPVNRSKLARVKTHRAKPFFRTKSLWETGRVSPFDAWIQRRRTVNSISDFPETRWRLRHSTSSRSHSIGPAAAWRLFEEAWPETGTTCLNSLRRGRDEYRNDRMTRSEEIVVGTWGLEKKMDQWRKRNKAMD